MKDPFLNIFVICSNSTGKNTGLSFAKAVEKIIKERSVTDLSIKEKFQGIPPPKALCYLEDSHRILYFSAFWQFQILHIFLKFWWILIIYSYSNHQLGNGLSSILYFKTRKREIVKQIQTRLLFFTWILNHPIVLWKLSQRIYFQKVL